MDTVLPDRPYYRWYTSLMADLAGQEIYIPIYSQSTQGSINVRLRDWEIYRRFRSRMAARRPIEWYYWLMVDEEV